MKTAFATTAFLLVLAAPASPQTQAPMLPKPLEGVGIDQKLDSQVPLDAAFTDESGRQVTLGGLLGRRPAILALVYYTCPALCSQILSGVVRGLRPLSLEPGRDFDIIAISINPKEGPADAAPKLQEYARMYSRSGSRNGWHFLTGTEPNIRRVASAVGFRYRYDPESKMFFHGAGIMILTPEGKAARYLYGVDYEPKDLKLGLIEAAHSRIGSPVDRILLFCYHYDPRTGKYTATVLGILHAAAAAFLALLVGFLVFLWHRDMRLQQRRASEAYHP
jgi:protein SCO1/2